MKIRNGFVSNSSSSSFVCAKCNEAYEGWDGDYGSIEQVICVTGHSFCSDCVSVPEDKDYQWDLPGDSCPICTFKILTDFHALQYLLDKYKTSKKEILEQIRVIFPNYEAFAERVLKGKTS